jgi:hypothetical protein
LRWNVNQLAQALRLKPEDVREYFTDGRRISLLIERRVMREVLNGRLAPHEGTPYDVVDAQNGNWDIRSISGHGVYFSPSHMVGSGRRFEQAGFFAKLDVLNGYVLADIERFPDIPYWKISTGQVRTWWQAGALSSDTKISRKRALELLEKAP